MIKASQKLFFILVLAVFGISVGLSVQAAGVWVLPQYKSDCLHVMSIDYCGVRAGSGLICCDALVNSNASNNNSANINNSNNSSSLSPSDSVATALQNLPDPMGVGGATPVSSQAAAQTVIARLINYVLGFIGSIALIMFIYGGIIWMTAAGSADKVKKGKNIIVWSALGLAVIFMAYIVVRFVVESLTM